MEKDVSIITLKIPICSTMLTYIHTYKAVDDANVNYNFKWRLQSPIGLNSINYYYTSKDCGCKYFPHSFLKPNKFLNYRHDDELQNNWISYKVVDPVVLCPSLPFSLSSLSIFFSTSSTDKKSYNNSINGYIFFCIHIIRLNWTPN